MSFSLGCRSYISRGELHITVYAERESPNSSNTPGPFESGLTGHRDRGDHDHNGNGGGSHASAAQTIAQSYGSTYSPGQDARATALKEKTVNAVSPAALQSLHETTQDYAKVSQAFNQTVQQFTHSKQALQQTVTSFQATNQQFNDFLIENADRLRGALAKKMATSDGSITPWSSLLLTNPLDLAMDQGRKLLSAICKSNPLIQQACQKVGMQNILVKKRALVLTGSASADHNGVLTLSMFTNFISTIVYLELERKYDVTYQRVSDVGSFCRAIDEETIKNGPTNLLILRAHGDKDYVQLDTDQSFTRFDPLPLDSCLQNLPSNATIILESCSTGWERVYNNFANYIKDHAPKGVRVFASTESTTGFVFSLNEEIEVKFRPFLKDITYKIDDKNVQEPIVRMF